MEQPTTITAIAARHATKPVFTLGDLLQPEISGLQQTANLFLARLRASFRKILPFPMLAVESRSPGAPGRSLPPRPLL